jgi:hypothetical protein
MNLINPNIFINLAPSVREHFALVLAGHFYLEGA